jgi:hypothetical protein
MRSVRHPVDRSVMCYWSSSAQLFLVLRPVRTCDHIFINYFMTIYLFWRRGAPPLRRVGSGFLCEIKILFSQLLCFLYMDKLYFLKLNAIPSLQFQSLYNAASRKKVTKPREKKWYSCSFQWHRNASWNTRYAKKKKKKSWWWANKLMNVPTYLHLLSCQSGRGFSIFRYCYKCLAILNSLYLLSS